MTKAISSALIDHREALGLSQYRVAKDTGIPRSTFRRIERGINVPSREHARALFAYYDKQVDLSRIYDPLFDFEVNNA